jgi:hypothetical protein
LVLVLESLILGYIHSKRWIKLLLIMRVWRLLELVLMHIVISIILEELRLLLVVDTLIGVLTKLRTHLCLIRIRIELCTLILIPLNKVIELQSITLESWIDLVICRGNWSCLRTALILTLFQTHLEQLVLTKLLILRIIMMHLRLLNLLLLVKVLIWLLIYLLALNWLICIICLLVLINDIRYWRIILAIRLILI